MTDADNTAAAPEAQPKSDAPSQAKDQNAKWTRIGVGAAIGSAAIAAALLYANRPARNDKR